MNSKILKDGFGHGAKGCIVIDLDKVDVGGEIGRRIDITVHNNLLKLDFEKDFLEPFRKENVHPSGYVGLGKLIDSTVSFAKYTNNPQVITMKERLIDEIIKTQGPDGYIGFFTGDDRMWAYWSGHEMVYIIQGLVNDYSQFGSNISLEAAEKLGKFIMERWATKPEYVTPWETQWLGLDRAFIGLSLASGDNRYVDFLEETVMSHIDWDDPPVDDKASHHNYTCFTDFTESLALKKAQAALKNQSDRSRAVIPTIEDTMENIIWDKQVYHVYTYLSHCIAQYDLYRLRPNEKLFKQAKRALDYMLCNNGLLINGSLSQSEHFHDNQDGCGSIGETCASAYLIRLLHNMVQFEENSLYGDIMERTIYNALFSAQSPDGRKLRYFSPTEGKRIYFNMDTYCCPCNYRRIIAELPGMIYYKSSAGVVINLYTQSSATIDLGKDTKVAIQQETDYPSSGTVTVRVNPSKPVQFPLKMRIPRWCGDSVSISVNGQKTCGNIKPGSFFTLTRKWAKGDTVELEMPMGWRIIKGRKYQKGRVAIMRGPLLFCVNVDRNKCLQKKSEHEQDNLLILEFATLLHRLRIDPGSLIDPVKDSSIRPNGLACKIKGWKAGSHPLLPPKQDFVLTEFTDPGGQATYFHVPKMDGAIDDELLCPDLSRQEN